ncbi:MAG: hypothetical protein PHD68_00415 [Rugosibacter sp.]|nr:hypothetical protein [Rugosibacter sp.]MDD3379667.1 hypothetical protein [Rugosibacter sp.]HPB90151.1 hypothetical protein [Rugosibacter sp.]HQN45580.1 hypothetical protein [Rugosibacter sp.]
MKIVYLTVAREEIREAAEYYAAISPELGNAFKRELRRLLRRMDAMLLAWPPSGAGLRKCLLSRFPWMMIYAPCRVKCGFSPLDISIDNPVTGGIVW